MRQLMIAFICVACLNGCAYYFTQRPPIMERKMGALLNESTGVLATSADYRIVYVKIKPGSPICAEPPPDVAGQFVSAFAAALSASPADRPASAEVQSILAVSMKQLVKRTQGLQHFRDSATDLCIDMSNGYISQQQYVEEKRALRLRAFELIKIELKNMGEINYDDVDLPDNTKLEIKPKTKAKPVAEPPIEEAQD